MFKAVVFDFDGTIANTLPICFNAFRRVTEPIVGKMTDSEIRAKYFGPYPDVGSAKETIQFIKEKFQIRQCKNYHGKDRPCLNYHIKKLYQNCKAKDI